MRYLGSDEQLRLKAAQTYVRYLLRKVLDSQDIPLDVSLPMINHINELEGQLRWLKSSLHASAHAQMTQMDVQSITTDQWEAVLKNDPAPVQVRSQEVAEAMLAQIQAQEIRRNKKLPEAVVKSITATTFWSLIDVLSVKWSKTKLKKKGINIEDYSSPGAPQNKVEITPK